MSEDMSEAVTKGCTVNASKWRQGGSVHTAEATYKGYGSSSCLKVEVRSRQLW
jgi:hypothetical protein